MDGTVAEIRLVGVPISPGVGLGIPCILRFPAYEDPHRLSAQPDDEEQRLLDSLAWMCERLEELALTAEAKLGPQSGEIFRSHLMILEDPVLRRQLFEAIERDKLRAEQAVNTHLESYERRLSNASDAYLRQRAEDIADLRRTLVSRLRSQGDGLFCRHTAHCPVGSCSHASVHIIVARELTPSLVMEADPQTVGFVVETCGATSHAAILARALRLPVVSGIRGAPDVIPANSLLLLDGDRGQLFLDPSDTTLSHFTNLRRSGRERPSTTHAPVPGFEVLANIDTASGVRAARAAGAEGIGLYRTEVEALLEGRLLTEEEQADRYAAVLAEMGDLPVYIRLLDIGADKVADWLELPREENPALGCRGARLLLARPELLRVQARALARAAARRPLHVIYPMIVDAQQFCRLKAAFEEFVADLPAAQTRHGVMFEVPSACLDPEGLLKVADFGCIGTNDLVQYLFAADRNHDGLAGEGLMDHPILWTVITSLAAASARHERAISVCGEIGGNPAYTERLMEAGIRQVSVSAHAVSEVREAAARRRR